MNDTESEALVTWLSLVATELGCTTDGISTDPLLAVARAVAHNQLRPGAPTTTFYLGYALGIWEQARIDAGEPVGSEARTEKLTELCSLVHHLVEHPTSRERG